MPDKKKILFISDHPLVPSGVGTQSKYLIEGLLKTGKYKFVCLGGAIKHPDYTPQKVDPDQFGDDWVILPVDGYGDKSVMRRMLLTEKPDAIFIFTDPRFFTWLWEMEDEFHQVCPLVYWHVWDNDPTPKFNKIYYDSTDKVVPLSLKTYGLLQDLGVKSKYIPHGIDDNLFKPHDESAVQEYKKKNFGPHANKKFIVFWNNRNARRKMTGDVLNSFALFADKVGKQNVALMLHTNVKDPEGQDIIAVAREFGIEQNLVISENRLPPEDLAMFYNIADCTVNIANNEGFGLGTLESLFCGTPIVVHMTGGLQFQVGPWWEGRKDFSDQQDMTAIAKKKYLSGEGEWYGVPVFPAARSCTGSQSVPYIYDDRVSNEDVAKGFLKLYEMERAGRKNLGLKGRQFALRNFYLPNMISSWDDVISEEIQKFDRTNIRPRYVTI